MIKLYLPNSKRAMAQTDIKREYSELLAGFDWNAQVCPHCRQKHKQGRLVPIKSWTLARGYTTLMDNHACDVELDILYIKFRCNLCGAVHTHSIVPWFVMTGSHYTLPFILSALKDKADGNMTNEEILTKYDICIGTLYNWRKRFCKQCEDIDAVLQTLSCGTDGEPKNDETVDEAKTEAVMLARRSTKGQDVPEVKEPTVNRAQLLREYLPLLLSSAFSVCVIWHAFALCAGYCLLQSKAYVVT